MKKSAGYWQIFLLKLVKGGAAMSKHKKKQASSPRVEAAAQKKAAKIVNRMHEQQKSIASLPKWTHDLAYHRFGWSEFISFIPLIIITLASPLLSDRVPLGEGLVVNKNALYIIPLASLLISAGCYFNIKIRRKGEQVPDIKHFASNELFTLFANVLVVVICSAVIIYQLYRAFIAV